MKARKTILIFGISSFVGSNLAEFLKKKYRVIGTYYDCHVSIEDVLCLPCDIFNREAIQMLIYIFRPDITIYSVGLSSVNDCAEKERLADSLNNTAAYNVVQFSERYKSRVIYLSSAFVFSGEKENCIEGDTPDPNTIYGKSKASGEFFIQKSCMNYLIFRCAQLYGRSLNPRQKTFFETLEQQLKLNQVLKLDDQVKLGFLDVHYLGMLIDIAIENDVSNKLLQVSSKDVMSYYDFALNYAEIFNANKDRVQKTRWRMPLERAIENERVLNNGLKFQLDVNNLENYMVLEAPTIRESLEDSYLRLGGKRDNKKSRAGTGDIDFI